MNFTQCHMERLDSIRESEKSSEMSSLISALNNTHKELIFVGYSDSEILLKENKTPFFTESDVKVFGYTLLIYMGTTEKSHYIAVVFKNPPKVTSIKIRDVMKLATEVGDIAGYGYSLVKFNQQYSFCPRCGIQMHYAGYGTHFTCGNCHNMCFPRTDPCIIVVVKHPTERKCLFVRKSIMPVNRYTCVAGFLEVGESIEKCVEREVWEEVQIHVKDVRYVTSSAYPINAANQIMIGCEATAINTNIDKEPGKELDEAFWVDEAQVRRAILQSKQEKPEGLYTVPPTYIAHQLFEHFVREN
uniref:NAD(+) diphosphatase n=1 Tax=Entamoeba invadens TaxID=33085 RepID=S0B1R7_ENTIV|nr:peroxisomal NADH pyrophosphatase NUDT12, putative [Entamoeba invadens]